MTHLIRRRSPAIPAAVVLLAAACAAATASIVAALVPPRYSATASLELVLPSADYPLIGAVGSSTESAAQQSKTEAVELNRDSIFAAAAAMLSPRPTVRALRGGLSIGSQNVSNLILVTAVESRPGPAARVADAFARAAVHFEAARQRQQFSAAAADIRSRLVGFSGSSLNRVELQRTLTALASVAKLGSPLRLRRPATPPSRSTAPPPSRVALLAAMAGLLVGIVALIVRRTLDPRLRTVADLRSEMPLPVIARIEDARRAAKEPFVPSPESMRALRRNVRLIDTAREHKVLVLTSPLAGAETTRIAYALALSAAAAAIPTLLMDCDFRFPRLSVELGVGDHVGIAEILAGTATFDLALVELGRACEVGHSPGPQGQKLPDMLPVGIAATAPELLASERFGVLMARARKDYRMIIINAPPLLPVIDAIELTCFGDVALICIRGGELLATEAADTAQLIAQTSRCPAGVVIIGAEDLGAEAATGYREAGMIAREPDPEAART